MKILKKMRSFPRWLFYRAKQLADYNRIVKDLKQAGYVGVGTEYVTTPSGIRLHVKPRFYETLMLWENMHEGIYEKYLSHTPKIILDLGAHKGFFSLRIATLYPDAQIYAVEASSENYEYLVQNTSSFTNIHPIHAAIWDSHTKLNLSLTEDHLHSLIKDSERKEEVQTITLSDLPKADFIKCDIEGAEGHIPFNADYVALEVEEEGMEALGYLQANYKSVIHEPPLVFAIDYSKQEAYTLPA